MTLIQRLNLTSIALVLVLLSVAIVSPAQSGEAVALFLKGGDVRFGKVINRDQAGNIRLANECGIFNIKATDIDSIKNYDVAFSNDFRQRIETLPQSTGMMTRILKESKESVSYKEKGFYNITSVALLFGQGQDGFLPIPSLTTVLGWQFNKKMLAGAGIGYEYYEWSVGTLFADLKYMVNQKNVMPFGSFKIGYALPIGKPSETDNYYGEITKYYGGIQLNPEAGIRLHIGQGSSLLLSIGYHFQQLAHDENTYYFWGSSSRYTTKVNTDYNRVSFRLGFMF
ncbi:MAG TPA: hypothetical protein VK212_01325 [Lentimicrobium sp.]|nr:hypothetical protein [Lentimicrobium sp.]